MSGSRAETLHAAQDFLEEGPALHDVTDVATHGMLRSVAEHALVGRIDLQHLPFGGDHDTGGSHVVELPLQALEHAIALGRQRREARFVLHALRDVATHHLDVLLTVEVAEARADLDRKRAAVLAPVARHEAATLRGAQRHEALVVPRLRRPNPGAAGRRWCAPAALHACSRKHRARGRWLRRWCHRRRRAAARCPARSGPRSRSAPSAARCGAPLPRAGARWPGVRCATTSLPVARRRPGRPSPAAGPGDRHAAAVRIPPPCRSWPPGTTAYSRCARPVASMAVSRSPGASKTPWRPLATWLAAESGDATMYSNDAPGAPVRSAGGSSTATSSP